MGLSWLWKDGIEHRATQDLNYTDTALARQLGESEGGAVTPDALAAVQAAVGLYELVFASTIVEPLDRRTQAITRAVLGIAGRELGLREQRHRIRYYGRLRCGYGGPGIRWRRLRSVVRPVVARTLGTPPILGQLEWAERIDERCIPEIVLADGIARELGRTEQSASSTFNW